MKLEKIKHTGMPLFEINLSPLYNDNSNLTRETITYAVLYQSDNRTWIYNPRTSEAIDWAEKEYRELLEQKKQEEKRAEFQQKKRDEEKQKKRKIAKEKIRLLFEPENYMNRLLELRDDERFISILKTCSFYNECNDKIPFFLDIPISGEMIFPCDHRIWQCLIFDHFVYNRNTKNDNLPYLHIAKIHNWLINYQNTIPIDWTIAHKTDIKINQVFTKNVSLLYDVIKQYLEYISYIGFISEIQDSEAKILAAHTLTPPNKENANILLTVLGSIDYFDPHTNYNIKQAILDQDTYIKTTYFKEKQKKERIIHENRKCFEREQGQNQVIQMDFNVDVPIADIFGYRWFLCTTCGCIHREDEMSYYGGLNMVNKGMCRNCSKK